MQVQTWWRQSYLNNGFASLVAHWLWSSTADQLAIGAVRVPSHQGAYSLIELLCSVIIW